MPQNYVPIFIFIAFVGVLLPVTLLAAKLVRPDNPSKTKLMPYECGIDPVDSSRGRYTVRYYIVAILFVVFDVETIFLFPWAVQFKALGLFGLVEMLIFLAILIVGLYGFGVKAPWNGFSQVGQRSVSRSSEALLAPQGSGFTRKFRNVESTAVRNLHCQPLDQGQFFLSRAYYRYAAAREPSEVPPVWEQRREHRAGKSRLGADFDGSDLVRDSY